MHSERFERRETSLRVSVQESSCLSSVLLRDVGSFSRCDGSGERPNQKTTRSAHRGVAHSTTPRLEQLTNSPYILSRFYVEYR